MVLPRRARLLLVGLLTLGLSPVALSDTAGRDKVRSELMEADRKFAAAAKARGLRGWMEFMAEDAVRLQKLGGTAVRGRAAIRKADAALFADATRQLLWEPSEAGAFADGRHGFTTGRYRVVK